MEPWQERVVQEKAELDSKIEKLDAFTLKGEFYVLDVDSQSLMKAQLSIMEVYSYVLGKCITKFGQKP